MPYTNKISIKLSDKSDVLLIKKILEEETNVILKRLFENDITASIQMSTGNIADNDKSISRKYCMADCDEDEMSIHINFRDSIKSSLALASWIACIAGYKNKNNESFIKINDDYMPVVNVNMVDDCNKDKYLLVDDNGLITSYGYKYKGSDDILSALFKSAQKINCPLVDHNIRESISDLSCKWKSRKKSMLKI